MNRYQSTDNAMTMDRLAFSQVGQRVIGNPTSAFPSSMVSPSSSRLSYNKYQDPLLMSSLSQPVHREEEYDSQKSFAEFQKNLHNYGKKFRDSNGNFQLKSVQEYYKKQESEINAKSLQDLEFLRREYVKRGGQNAEFLQNVMSMQSYFAHKSNPNEASVSTSSNKHKAMINNPNALHMLRVDATDALVESYSHPAISQANLMESFQQEMQNHTMMNIRNQLTLPSSNPSFIGGAAGDSAKIAGLRSDSERMYEYLNMQESDLLRDLQSMHANSVQYQVKMDEVQKVRVLKNEIEKSVIVNRIFGSNPNTSFADQANSFNPTNQSILQKSFVMRAAGAASTRGGYSTNEGFIIRFDYLSFIPPTFQDVQIRFGIFKRGQALDPFLHTAIYPAEQDSPNTAKCIVSEKREIHQVIPHVDAIMYFEMHANERNPQKRKIILKAWTIHEIFDEQLNLNCGRFKLPFYSKNVTPTQLMQTNVGNVTPIAECNMFVRICFPNDPYFDNETLVFLESEYLLPSFHSRNDPNAPPQSQQPNQQRMQNRQMLPVDPDESQRMLLQDLENIPQKRPPSAADSLLKNQQGGRNTGGTIRLMNTVASQFQDQLDTEESGNQSQMQASKKQMMIGSRQPQQQDKLSLNQSQSSFYNTPYIQFSNKNEAAIIAPSVASRISEEPTLIDGVIVHIVKLEQFVKQVSLKALHASSSQQQQQNKKESVRVNLKIFDGSTILSDSQSKLCEATSGDTVLQTGVPNTIDFEHAFMLKIRQILQTYGPTRLRSVYLMINLINAANVSIAWLVTPIFKVDYRNIGDINNGRFRQNMFQPPLKKAPFTTISLKTCKPSELVLEYLIHDPELLETEIKLYDTSIPNNQQQQQQPGQIPSIPTQISSTSIGKIPLGASSKMQSSMKDLTASPRNKSSQLAATKDMVIKPAAVKKSVVDGPRNLLIIEADSLQKYTSGMSVSFDLVILRESDMVNDEFGNPCVFHFEELIPVEATGSSTVVFQTQIKMPLDLQRAMSEKRPGWELYHLLFKFVEVDTDDSERTLGWYIHPLYKNARIVNQGKFVVNVNQQPITIGLQASTNASVKKRSETFHFTVISKLLKADEYNTFANVNAENAITQQTVQMNKNNNTKSSASLEQRLYTAEVSELIGVENGLSLQVNAVLLLGDEFMTDDSGEKCTYQGDLKTAVSAGGKGSSSSRTNGIITFLEEYAFEVDIAKIAVKYKSQLSQIRLVLYFLGKDSAPKYWYFCQVFDAKGVVRLGTFEVKIYNTPFQRFQSLDKSKLKESKVIMKLKLSEGVDDQ